MGSPNSAGVSSSPIAGRLEWVRMGKTATKDTNKEQIAARFIEFPPEPSCILVLFHVLKPPLFGLNAKAEDDNNLHEQKTDHQAEDTANPVRPEKGDGQEGRENRRGTPKSVADTRGPQANFRREQFRNVNCEKRSDEDVDGNGQ